ncbi:C2 domain-containing protein [Mycena rebaudengoi]|nr:C2 domain-containing protein [Mycena rebaudengoi]
MLTLDLKESNHNLVVRGKLIIYLSTDVSHPINNPGPSQVSGLNTAMANMGLNTSPTASTSNLTIAASTAPLTRSHATQLNTTAQAVPSVIFPVAASPEPGTASAAIAAAAAPSQFPSDSRPTSTVGTSPASAAQSLSSEFVPMNEESFRRELKNEVVVQAPNEGSGILRKKIRVTVVAADGLSKRDVFRLPDPFAIINVDAEQIHTTSVIRKTLNPCWNESFDITVKDLSVVAVQIFDQRKFKRPDQGFLGVINVRVSDVLDLRLDCHEMLTWDLKKSNHNLAVRGKLIIYLSTDVSHPINNRGPSQVSGLNTAMANMGLNTSPTASTSNLAIAASTTPLTRTPSSHATESDTTA